MNKINQEIKIVIIFLGILLLLLNPFQFFMPNSLVYIMLGGVFVLFGVYVSFVLKETPRDEREQLHRFIANRTAYLFGSAILVVAIIYQGVTSNHIDPWLIVVLGVMVLAKVLSLRKSNTSR